MRKKTQEQKPTQASIAKLKLIKKKRLGRHDYFFPPLLNVN